MYPSWIAKGETEVMPDVLVELVKVGIQNSSSECCTLSPSRRDHLCIVRLVSSVYAPLVCSMSLYMSNVVYHLVCHVTLFLSSF
jgi:hypothetical protein